MIKVKCVGGPSEGNVYEVSEETHYIDILAPPGYDIVSTYEIKGGVALYQNIIRGQE